MALLGLCVVKGDTVTVSVEGANEDTTVVEMEKFFKENM
ncbi:MAG: HPr family phosphocarrier protein [Lachnospiraceae bacterium]|nr:HPr family phosphocarrier protein [Lachnospiraceae bacterium]